MTDVAENPPYTPALLRALLWISGNHRGAPVEVTHYRDEAGVGWSLVTVVPTTQVPHRPVRRYIASPTGRVWRADEWADTPTRVEPPIRNADYDDSRTAVRMR